MVAFTSSFAFLIFARASAAALFTSGDRLSELPLHKFDSSVKRGGSSFARNFDAKVLRFFLDASSAFAFSLNVFSSA